MEEYGVGDGRESIAWMVGGRHCVEGIVEWSNNLVRNGYLQSTTSNAIIIIQVPKNGLKTSQKG